MLLSIDSSAITASCALTDNDTVIKSEFMNTGLTHSETLLPMIKRVVGDNGFDSVDSIAITVGPGSFTGVRIGVATAKGIAFNNNIPCIPVSTLEAIAYAFDDMECVVCAVMDARRMQFYNAIFECKNGVVTRLTDDRAISIEDLRTDLSKYSNIIIAGDGAQLCYDNIGIDCTLADDDRIYQNAVNVSKAAKNHTPLPPNELMPVYLRLSQAERELKMKLKK